MKVKILVLSLFMFSTIGVGACISENKEIKWVQDNVDYARKQLDFGIHVIESNKEFINPVTLKKDGTPVYCGYADWRSGFFPGTIWYLYELTDDEKYKDLAKKYTEMLRQAENITWNHDIGFIVSCSFGNGLRLTGNKEYESVIVKSAKSLLTRFRSQAGIIQSWDVARGWQSTRGWECPVIIDNMMNLELLFEATRLSGDSIYYKTAVSHADRTMKEHFRKDGSSYHVIDYSLTDGKVRAKQTGQGFSDESVWSRGQSWAIYGYVICYRETGDKKYLEQALKTFEVMKNHPAMPEDCIPYWDMSAPNIPNEPRDASSASCMASALYEISTMDINNASFYKQYADRIMKSLASTSYRAPLGENGNFLLMHNVGSLPHGAEIDVPLNYADYYFMEALKRKRDIERTKAKM